MRIDDYPHNVIHKGRSFFSTLAWGASMVVVTVLASGTIVALYGLNIVDRKTGNVFEFVEETIRSLPEIGESLPPMLADIVNDTRQPEYLSQLDVSATVVKVQGKGHRVRPVIEVRNRGDQVVSLLSMRLVLVDSDNHPLAEVNEWGATPVAADDEWRGPLLPGAHRRFLADRFYLGHDDDGEDLRVEVEVTDIRVWNSEHRATQVAYRPDEGKL